MKEGSDGEQGQKQPRGSGENEAGAIEFEKDEAHACGRKQQCEVWVHVRELLEEGH